MSIPDQLVSYQKFTGNPIRNYVTPRWVFDQTLPYPAHPRHSELIRHYDEAYEVHFRALEVLQLAVMAQSKDSANQQKLSEVSRCQVQVSASREKLAEAEKELRDFNSHTPEQRISLIEEEITRLEEQLLEAHAAESDYTQTLLDDPEANRQKLERLVHGYRGTEAEYSSEQLAKLRVLRGKVRSIEGDILNHQRDIALIRALVIEQENKATLQAAMDEVLPRFAESCIQLSLAWAEVKNIAAKHNVRVYEDIRIPKQATFRHSDGAYSPASININWK